MSLQSSLHHLSIQRATVALKKKPPGLGQTTASKRQPVPIGNDQHGCRRVNFGSTFQRSPSRLDQYLASPAPLLLSTVHLWDLCYLANLPLQPGCRLICSPHSFVPSCTNGAPAVRLLSQVCAVLSFRSRACSLLTLSLPFLLRNQTPCASDDT